MVSKKELTEKRRRKKSDEELPNAQVSENQEFLTGILNSNIEERKKLSQYLSQINNNIRVLEQIIKKVK